MIKSALSTYAFIDAKLKTRLSKALTEDLLENMIQAHSLSEAVQMLKGSAYNNLVESFNKSGDLKACEAALKEQELNLYTELFKFVKDPVLSFIKTLSMRLEIESIKNAIRLWFDLHIRKRAIEDKPAYLLQLKSPNSINFNALVHAEDIASLIFLFKHTVYTGLAQKELPVIAEKKSVFTFESALDRFYYKEVFDSIKKFKKKDQETAKRIIGIEVDLSNISAIIRYKDHYKLKEEDAALYFIPYGRYVKRSAVKSLYDDRRNSFDAGFDLLPGHYSDFWNLQQLADSSAHLMIFEQVLKHIALAEAKRNLMQNPFSIGIIMDYFVIMRAELFTVMSILNAKNYSLSGERIRSVL